MKKIISILLATTLMFAVSVPAMSASDTFLADKTVYFDTDRIEDNLAVGTKVEGKHFTADSGWTVPTGFSSVYNGGMAYTLKEDAVKGKYIETSTTTNYSRFYNTSPMDCVAGDRYIFEFSVKHNNGTNDKIDFSGIGDQTTLQGDFQYAKVNEVYVLKRRGKGGETIKNDFVVGEWYHIVAEITPGETSGTIQFYVNGVAAGTTYSSSIYTVDNFQKAWKNMQLDIDGAIDVDDIRMYKLTSAYDPATAGDVASVSSSTLTIENDTVEFTNEASIADVRGKLTAAAGGSITFLTSENVAIEDESTAPAAGIKVVARSASGAVVKVYTLAQGEAPSTLVSSVYTIEEGIIKAVPHFTKLADFQNAFTVDGTATPVYSTEGTYVQDGDTITLGNNVYTVELETFVDYPSFRIGGSNHPLITSDGRSPSGISDTQSVATLEGKEAWVYNPGGNGANLAAGLVEASAFGSRVFKTGEVVNLEFSYFGRADTELTVIMANRQVAVINGDTVRTGVESGNVGVTLSEKVVPNAWNKIVVSAVVNDKTDEENTETKYRIFVNGVQCDNPESDDGYFRSTIFNWTTSATWRFKFVCPTYNATDADADTAGVADLKIYTSAISDYDTSITAGDYHAEDGVIYVASASDVDTAVAAINYGGKAHTVNDNEGMDKIVYVTDLTGIRTQGYKFRLENDIYEENGRIKAYSPIGARLYYASYNSAGEFVDVEYANGDGTNVLSIKKDALKIPDGYVTRVYLWSKNLVPIAFK